jgi:hypothetical protein
MREQEAGLRQQQSIKNAWAWQTILSDTQTEAQKLRFRFTGSATIEIRIETGR